MAGDALEGEEGADCRGDGASDEQRVSGDPAAPQWRFEARACALSRMMYGGVYMRHSLPMSKSTVDSAPKREVPPGTCGGP